MRPEDTNDAKVQFVRPHGGKGEINVPRDDPKAAMRLIAALASITPHDAIWSCIPDTTT